MSGINLDAEWVRADVREAPDEYDPDEIAAVEGASDAEIEDAITSAIDDHFWAAHDGLRGDAIRLLTRRAGR